MRKDTISDYAGDGADAAEKYLQGSSAFVSFGPQIPQQGHRVHGIK